MGGGPALTGANGPVLRISLVYMGVGFAVFLAMGLLGLLMRLNHAGFLTLRPDWFYTLMTLHGSGMVTGVMLASMGGVLALLRPSQGSGRLLWGVFLVYFLGAGFVILATLLGGFAGGWTVLYPLPLQSQGQWGLGAALAMLVGYLFVALAFLAYCLVVLTTLRARYGSLPRALAWPYLFSGGRKGGEALPTPTELVAGVVGVVGVLTVLAGAFYLLPIFAQAGGLLARVDALLAKNLLFLFGHNFVNLNIYLAAGLVYATLPAYTGRPFRTTWLVALALNLVLLLVILPYFHHLYQDFAQPLPLHIVGQIGSYGVGVPAFLVTILGALGLIHRSGIRWGVAPALIAVGLWGWTFGGLGAVLDSTIAVNAVMHNTLWVVAHFHTYYLLGTAAFTWAFLFHLVRELSGRSERGVSRALAWLYGMGGAGFVLMFFLSGAFSVARRYAVHFPEWQVFARVAVPFVLVLAVGVAWLAWEIFSRMGTAWRGAERWAGGQSQS